MKYAKNPFGSIARMKPTQIVKCSKCQGLMLTTKAQKTKTCPYCGARVDLLWATKVASAKNPFEASSLLRKLKSEKGAQQ